MADTRELAAQLRASLSALKRDVATSFRLCGRDFGVLGSELLSALERGRQHERASVDALAHERAARGQLETRLAELQGNIRVLCRVRPMPVAPGSSGEESESTSPERRRKRIQVASAQELSVFSPVDGALYKSFSFSRVFHEQHAQLTVFKEVAPLVRSAVTGHHACVFAYGQTGAGKTHTM
ncbi:Kinesin family member C1, partial [Phytophthora palmivora]